MKTPYTLDDLFEVDETGYQLAGEDSTVEEIIVNIADLGVEMDGTD